MREVNIPITRPLLPDYERLEERVRDIFSTGQLTNNKFVRELEETIAAWIGTQYAVAVSSCTVGLAVTLKSLHRRGEVILPSFTFSATGHAVMWAGLTPCFVDIEPGTMNVDPEKVRERITDNTVAILAVHVFGNPAPVDDLIQIAGEHDLPLLFDAAHGIGAVYNGSPVGRFGSAEVFSVSPTKLLVCGEGGFVTTNDTNIARYIRLGRNYGDPGDYDCEFPGLNARMTEFNVILGLESFRLLPDHIQRRRQLADRYRQQLRDVPGITFQTINPHGKSSWKDFVIVVKKELFGMDRDELRQILDRHGIASRRYFFPPIHLQKAYRSYAQAETELPVTIRIANNILSLPMYYDMTEDMIDTITGIIADAASR